MSTGLIGEILTLLGIPENTYYLPVIITCAFVVIFELLFYFLKLLFNVFGIRSYK